MSGLVTLDYSDFERLASGMNAFGNAAPQVVNETLHNDAGQIIYGKINPLIHPSGRTFKGHGASATASDWPHYDTSEAMAVTVKTKTKFNYLYFPDDGSNTKRHAGGQDFTGRGGLAAVEPIVDLCLDALAKKAEETL